MPNVLIFYACSAAAIILLLLFALHNRRIGWRRNRIYAEWLPVWQWFEASAGDPSNAPPPRTPPPEPEQLGAQLLALSAALTDLDQRATPGAADLNPSHKPPGVAQARSSA